MKYSRNKFWLGFVLSLMFVAVATLVFAPQGVLSYGSKGLEVSQVPHPGGVNVTEAVDTATDNALGLSSAAAAAYTPTQGVSAGNDVMLLARIIHAEAKGEPYIGKVAVGAVILNRVESPVFPSTLSGVLFQPLAFQAVSNGTIWNQPDSEAVRAANNALSGWDPSYGCLYFWNPATSTSRWIWSKSPVMQVGKHVFAK